MEETNASVHIDVDIGSPNHTLITYIVRALVRYKDLDVRLVVTVLFFLVLDGTTQRLVCVSLF